MEATTRKKKTSYSVMDGFISGMGSVGQIFPPARQHAPTNWASAWQGVGDAFAAAGDNLRDAIDEFRNAQGVAGKAAHGA